MLVTWRLFLLFSTFVLPQLLGLLLYFRLSRFPKWLAHAVGILAPAILFFYLSPHLFFSDLREAQRLKQEITCGMPALGALFMVVLGTAAEAFVGMVVQLYMFRRRNA
jgi:surface polysaccharide O-acyltransferase-like enzyme